MQKSIRLAPLILVALISGCDKDERVAPLEARVAALEVTVRVLNRQVSTLEMANIIGGGAYLTPGDEGYSVVKGDLGSLIVRLINIEPYASGSKVTLQFGNLSSVTIEGLKAKIEWGTIDKKSLPDTSAIKSRNVVFEDMLFTGVWTNSTIVLEGIPPVSLGFVRLSELGHRGVRMR